ncbi:MAG: sigma-70 family RNA polymerase sigma factor [Deltaproteobacteria bacterium]|nr:sigma-70 family RNA polymerase sigma factor [Deltaproteobacteria bacterium]MDZ4343430.1 sigma-70 family RNA polymerase sigma factor [Candidatus Binatia bacterium]
MLVEGIGDAECVKRVQRGDADSFEVLVRRHQKATFNLVYRLLGDYEEAAEVAQEVFLSAFKSIQQFRGDAIFSTWLYRIAFNHASTRRKSLQLAQQRHVPLDGRELIGDGDAFADPEKTAQDRETQQRVQRALNSLSKDDAAVIILRDLQDAPYEEVAQMLDIPIGTVKSRLHRARRALKELLAPQYCLRKRKAS